MTGQSARAGNGSGVLLLFSSRGRGREGGQTSNCDTRRAPSPGASPLIMECCYCCTPPDHGALLLMHAP